jgi:hypothetical protein
MMTPETIAELRRLLAEATPGPWKVEMSNANSFVKHKGKLLAGCYDGLRNTLWDERDNQNARIIATAVNALPSLLADLEAAQKEKQVLREALRGQLFGVPHRILLCTCERCELLRKAALAATEAK